MMQLLEAILWLTTSGMLFYAGYYLDKYRKRIKALEGKLADVEVEKSQLFNQVSKTKKDIRTLIGEDSIEKMSLVKMYNLEFALDAIIWAGDSKKEWRKFDCCDGVLVETPIIFCNVNADSTKSIKEEEE